MYNFPPRVDAPREGPVTDAVKERIIASLRELARGPDDPYMLLAVKNALEVIVPKKR